jgi:hypothetical protein
MHSLYAIYAYIRFTIYMHPYMCVCMRTYINTHAYMYKHICTSTWEGAHSLEYTHTYTHTYIHTQASQRHCAELAARLDSDTDTHIGKIKLTSTANKPSGMNFRHIYMHIYIYIYIYTLPCTPTLRHRHTYWKNHCLNDCVCVYISYTFLCIYQKTI